MNDMLVY